MMIYLRSDEIDLRFDEEDPLQLVAELEKAVRRHGIRMLDIGVDSRYMDMYLDNNDPVVVQLGSCRGTHLKKLIRILNESPVAETPNEQNLPGR
ncbi:hypothetical protein [Streptomyces triticirhizae]|uniref:Uncharacterized protein n=1 Tax=Streptomyces triticirhizae TaxID=2483353 RepID=A0A3M2LL16_9ACTN|nr:hypothetical protein [Streptomyces triticirhizae]RMI38132.1 hypothetical protein EBN88_17470 [Streptomyces triticirhizae]